MAAWIERIACSNSGIASAALPSASGRCQRHVGTGRLGWVSIILCAAGISPDSGPTHQGDSAWPHHWHVVRAQQLRPREQLLRSAKLCRGCRVLGRGEMLSSSFRPIRPGPWQKSDRAPRHARRAPPSRPVVAGSAVVRLSAWARSRTSVASGLPGRSRALRALSVSMMRCSSASDLPNDVVHARSHAIAPDIEALRPDVRAGLGRDQLRVDAQRTVDLRTLPSTA